MADRATNPNSIRQGQSFQFRYGIEGPDAVDFTPVFDLVRFPGGTKHVDGRALVRDTNDWKGSISKADTDTLDPGQYFINIRASDNVEDIGAVIKLYIAVKYG